MGNVYAAEISIIPLKKPTLNKKIQDEKISQSIPKPKPKPKLSKKTEKIETKIVKKDVKKN